MSCYLDYYAEQCEQQEAALIGQAELTRPISTLSAYWLVGKQAGRQAPVFRPAPAAPDCPQAPFGRLGRQASAYGAWPGLKASDWSCGVNAADWLS